MAYLRAATIAIIALFCLFSGAGDSAFAQEAGKVVRADFTAKHIDIVPFLGAVQSDKPEVSVKLPPNGSGLSENITLKATSSGPVYRWVVFTTANPGVEAEELVIDSARQSFPGSGIKSPTYSSSRISAVSSNTSVELRRLSIPDRDAFVLTVPPRTSVSVALELAEVGVSGVRLWQRSAFNANAYRQALYRGIVLGMAILAVVVITCLVMLSPQIVFPLSMIFAWPAVAFITLETGQLETALAAVWPFELPSHEVLSAIVEACMMAGVFLMAVTIMRTRKQMPMVSALLMIAGGAGLALAGYAIFEPVLVKQISRIGFAVAVTSVLLAALVLARRGGLRARSSLMVWVLLGVWTIAAGYIALNRPPSDVASPVLVGGLALVLVALSFVLTYFAFSNVLNPESGVLEAERNTIALASASQIVWDFQPGDNTFYLGPQLERVLGYQENSLDNTSVQSWLALVHPNDHTAYYAALETVRQRGNQQFEQQLRLRHADGRYRWYTLKGTSLQNASETGLRLIGVLSDASDERSSQDRLLTDAIYDVVTGLPNYALFLDRLGQAVSRASLDPKRKLNVVIIEIDRFAVVNSKLGQEIGDSLRNTIARRLERQLSETGSLARMPGDQFAIIHEASGPGDPMEEVIVFVDQIRHVISQPVRVPPNEIYLTCSVGVAQWDAHMQSADVLYRSAEIALFEAKAKGRDKVAFYAPGMRPEPTPSLLVMEDLQSALQERRFELVYQPIMRLPGRQLAGFEALVRLRQRDGELLEPSSFVPLAERCGLIGEIGAFVLNEAARQLGVWQRMFTPVEPIFVSVNVSSAQLSGPRLLQLAKTILTREELVPGTLKLELTETLVMENPELSLRVLDRLKAMGIGLSCDDFGTGYSSLSYLRRLPFDTLKVDKSFLQAGIEDERGSVVLDAIILLAHDLGLQVVAEGVETEDQLSHLIELECDFAQGFLIGEPIAAQHVLAALGAPAREPVSSASGMAALWARLTRKPKEAPPLPVVLPEPDELIDDEALVPWSPYDFHPAPWAPRLVKPVEEVSEPVNDDVSANVDDDEPDGEPEPADMETVTRQVEQALEDIDVPEIQPAISQSESEATKPALEKTSEKDLEQVEVPAKPAKSGTQKKATSKQKPSRSAPRKKSNSSGSKSGVKA